MFINSLTKAAQQVIGPLDSLSAAWWFVLRVWIAAVFFKSGLAKLDDFETTVFLFTDEYKVPILSPYIAALSATFFETAAPLLLFIGLGTRLAVLPLLVMTGVIQFTYMDHVQHYYWALVLSGLLFHGADRYSADYLIRKRLTA